MAYKRKTIFAKVSTSAGTYLKTWYNIDFPGFTKQLNGGPSECVIKYAVAFDYDGSDLREGNDIELVICDGDTLADTSNLGSGSTRTIYKGYVSLIEREIEGQNETVTVHVLGYYTQLSLDVLKNGTQTTLYSISTTGLTTTIGSNNAADVGL